MTARDRTGKVTNPVNFKTVKGRPVPDEPHIGSTEVERDPKEATEQAGFARGGTTRPPKGDDGGVKQLDNDGNPIGVHPGEIAKITKEDGPKAAADKVGSTKKGGK